MNAPLQTSLTSTDALPPSWVERIFDQMWATFGQKFVQQWAGIDPEKLKAHWAIKLSGLSTAELKRGVDALDSQTFCPTLPEFIKLCRPPIDVLAAYHEAVNGIYARERGEVGQWSHPAIFWASVAVGAFDLKTMSYTQIKNRWENALQAEIDKGQWVDIPAPALSLPAPSSQAADPLAAAKVMEQVQQVTNSNKTDHKAWAKKIMAAVKRGDKNVMPVAVRMAKEALAEAE